MCSNVSAATFLTSLSEEELLELDTVKTAVTRILHDPSQSTSLMRQLFEKLAFAFMVGSTSDKVKILELLYRSSIQHRIPFEKMGYDTIVGNIYALYAFVKQNELLDFENVVRARIIHNLQCLQEIESAGIPFTDQIILNLDERISSVISKPLIVEIIEACDLLFSLGLIQRSKLSVGSFLRLYTLSDNDIIKTKGNLIAAMLDGKQEIFFATVKFLRSGIRDERDLGQEYTALYHFFLKMRTPVYFEHRNIQFNDELVNNNFYFVKIKNKREEEEIVWPYQHVSLARSLTANIKTPFKLQ